MRPGGLCHAPGDHRRAEHRSAGDHKRSLAGRLSDKVSSTLGYYVCNVRAFFFAWRSPWILRSSRSCRPPGCSFAARSRWPSRWCSVRSIKSRTTFCRNSAAQRRGPPGNARGNDSASRLKKPALFGKIGMLFWGGGVDAFEAEHHICRLLCAIPPKGTSRFRTKRRFSQIPENPPPSCEKRTFCCGVESVRMCFKIMREE